MKPSRTSAVRNGKHTITMNVDLSAVNELLAKLEGDIHAAVRPAAQAGAQVIYEAVLKNVDAIGSVTGNLRNAIYQKFSDDKSVVAPGGGYARATYHISWNASKAPHGHLVEYGHIQRYAAYIGSDGKWHTAVRPEARGKKKPARNASQAVKDAHYVLRANGPQQIAAHPFIRPAFYQQGAAALAIKAKLLELLKVKQ